MANDTAPKSAELRKVREQNARATKHPVANWKTPTNVKSPKGPVAMERTAESGASGDYD